MADKKQPQSVRFRLPWRTRGSQVKPEPRPVAKTQNPAQTTTSVPVERSPFRPAGKAPVKDSPSPPSRNEPPPPSPSRSATKPQKSFGATTQTRVEVESSTSSPSRSATKPQKSFGATTQTRVEVESSTSSPSRSATESQKSSSATTQPPVEVESPTSSPSRSANDSQKSSSATTQPEVEVESPTSSPSHSATESQKSSNATTQPPVEVESPTSSPSRAATESQKSSSATTQSRVEVKSSTSSPSRAATESQKTSSATAQTRVESFQSSPSGIASQLQAASQETPQAQSQSHTQENSQLPSFSAESPSPATEPEPKEPNTEISTSETISKAQNNTPPTTVQTHAASSEAVETVASPEKVDPDAIGGDQKHHPESESDSKEHKEGGKGLQEVRKEETGNDPDYKELMQETATHLHSAATGVGKHAKDLLGVASQAEQWHKNKEAFDRKETLASTSTSSSLQSTKTPKDTSTSRMVASTAEHAPRQKEIREQALKFNKLATEDQMLENPVSVVTLAGENTGASMQVSSEPAKGESVPIHRSYKTNPDDSLEATTDGEVSSEGAFDQTSKEGEQMIAYINSNVQSINNAIMFNASVAERNPGVQTVFSQKPAESIKPNGKTEPLETHNAQITKTPSEKLTHVSTVRRRCLRGLFMEPSDSEPDNPEKPRRHGCRYSCGMKREDTDIGIL